MLGGHTGHPIRRTPIASQMNLMLLNEAVDLQVLTAPLAEIARNPIESRQDSDFDPASKL
jgi:hypothetical protein